MTKTLRSIGDGCERAEFASNETKGEGGRGVGAQERCWSRGCELRFEGSSFSLGGELGKTLPLIGCAGAAELTSVKTGCICGLILQATITFSM